MTVTNCRIYLLAATLVAFWSLESSRPLYAAEEEGGFPGLLSELTAIKNQLANSSYPYRLELNHPNGHYRSGDSFSFALSTGAASFSNADEKKSRWLCLFRLLPTGRQGFAYPNQRRERRRICRSSKPNLHRPNRTTARSSSFVSHSGERSLWPQSCKSRCTRQREPR